MSDYTIQVSWSGKDALDDSDPAKVISGDDFNTEFTAARTAINSKADINGDATENFTMNNGTVGGTLAVTGATTLSSTLAVTGTITSGGNTVLDTTDLGSSVAAYDADTLFADVSDNLTVGFTCDYESLASDTIAPDLTAEALKYRAATGAVTINTATGGNGVCHILVLGSGGTRAISAGTGVKAAGTLASAPSGGYALVTVVHINSVTSISSVEVA